MNAVFGMFLSLSVSGGLLILVLLLGRRLWRDAFSRQWQYYIWLLVILRLLVPFGPKSSLPGLALQTARTAVTQAAALPQGQPEPGGADGAVAAGTDENAGRPKQGEAGRGLFQETAALLADYAGLVWLAGALVLLVRKATAWQNFVQYLRAGAATVDDLEMLDLLSAAAEQAGVRRPVELWAAPMVSSPLLIGFFRPCIVLPDTNFSQEELRHIILHELTHFRRGDLFYKWLVQLAVCLHWFNPLVHLMSREIERACELSCDEAVLARLGRGSAQDYGRTLLNAVAAAGNGPGSAGAVSLGRDKRLLRERLDAIVKFRKRSKPVRCLTAALTVCLGLGAVMLGVPAAADTGGPALSLPPAAGLPDPQPAKQQEPAALGEPDETAGGRSAETALSELAEYYEAGSLPLFERAFARLEQGAQVNWLERLYTERDFAFFSAAVHGLGMDSPLRADLAEKAYAEDEPAFFSVLADWMEEPELEAWLGRALEDGNWAFQSMLYDRLGRGKEFDEKEEKRQEEAEAARQTAYGAVGVTTDGRAYYYEGQRVNVFLDIRANGAFYTLNMDPAGTIYLRILRDEDDRIADAVLMTEAEAESLLSDLS